MSQPPNNPTEPSAELQEMQRFIVAQLQRDRALPKVPVAAAGASQYLTGNDRLTPAEQLDIYRVQFWLRHTSALLEDNPGVSGVLGQAEWELLVESYFAKQSPTSWTLRDLGKGFAAHIATRPETPHQELCTDMARLEWAYTEVFDAAEAPPLEPASLATLPPEAWETARMRINPALRLLSVNYPVAELRRELRRAQAGAEDAATDIPARQPQHLVVYRNHKRVLLFASLEPTPFRLLQLLTDGVPLVPACEAAAAEDPANAQLIEASVSGWFQNWGANGWIVGVDPVP